LNTDKNQPQQREQLAAKEQALAHKALADSPPERQAAQSKSQKYQHSSLGRQKSPPRAAGLIERAGLKNNDKNNEKK
jgi:hypothetical protein